jgi:hypothetical protein
LDDELQDKAAMKDLSISLLTICGLTELEQHGSRGVTHVLSILDPDRATPTISPATTGITARRCAFTTSSSRWDR